MFMSVIVPVETVPPVTENTQTTSDPIVQALDILALGIVKRNEELLKVTGRTYAWSIAERKAYQRAIMALRGKHVPPGAASRTGA